MYFKKDNLTIYYEKYGSKKESILILPGWGNTSQTFKNIIEVFKEKYTIYILDYPGFGNSPTPEQELTIYNYAELINSFIKEKIVNNPIIIAHSFGGRITDILLGKYKLKIKKVILFDVAGLKQKKSIKQILKEKLYKLLKKLVKLLPKKEREKYYRKLLLIFGSTDYLNLPASMHKTFQNIIKEDLKDYYRSINAEVLIIWGDKDTDTPLKVAYKLHKIINNSGLIIYKNSGHFSYLDYPEKTNIILNKFI